jgi:hypothetical protein
MPAEKELLVRVLDVPSLTWSVLQPSSAAPPARGGHSVRSSSAQLSYAAQPAEQETL